MNDTPLHMRLADMTPDAVADEFPHMLERDLLDQGFTPEDAENARQAAMEVMHLCGVMAPAPMRRRKAQASSIEATQRTRAATMERKRQEAEPDVHTLTLPQASSEAGDGAEKRLAA